MAFHFISWGRCTVKQPSSYLNTLHWHKCIVLMLQQFLICNNQSSLKGSLVCYPHRIFHYLSEVLQCVNVIMSLTIAAVTGCPSGHRLPVWYSCCTQGHCTAHISVNCVTPYNFYLPGPLWLLMQHLPQDVQCTGKWVPLLDSKPEVELCFQFFIMLESGNLCRNVPFSHVSSSPPPPPPFLSSLTLSCHSFWCVSLSLISMLKSNVDRFIITWLLLLFSWCSYTSLSGNWKESHLCYTKILSFRLFHWSVEALQTPTYCE